MPDNTEIATGATFVKTWRLKNNGSCTWTSGYTMYFYNGDAMSGPASAQLTNGTVPPGSTIDISVTLIAPTTPGTYKGNWRITQHRWHIRLVLVKMPTRVFGCR